MRKKLEGKSTELECEEKEAKDESGLVINDPSVRLMLKIIALKVLGRI